MTTANPAMGSSIGPGLSASDAEVDQLLHPSRHYARPADVVADSLLTIDERRAILASWASDACAVESNPPLRRLPHASVPVTYDEIIDALQQLDRMKRSKLSRQRGTQALSYMPRHLQHQRVRGTRLNPEEKHTSNLIASKPSGSM